VDTTFAAIVDDDGLMRGALQGLLSDAGLRPHAIASAEEFLQSGHHRCTGCLITDLRTPGLYQQARLSAEQIPIPTIFVAEHGDASMRMQALRAGAVEFLAKPFDNEVLLEGLRAAFER
jgi:FixJ family two-component response regulator